MKSIRAMWNDGWAGDRGFLVTLAILIVLIPVSLYSLVQKERQWHAYKDAHACQVVGRMDGSFRTGFGYGMLPNGQSGMAITTSRDRDKTDWLCDDGITYWK